MTFEDFFRDAVNESVERGREEAVRRSSGPHSSKELAENDHPLAVRHGFPRIDPSVANYQSGELANSWQTRVTDSGAQIRNDSPHADFVANGNVFTFARPEVEMAIEAFTQDDLERSIYNAIEQAYGY